MRVQLRKGIKWCKNEGVVCSEGEKQIKSSAARRLKWCKSEGVFFRGGKKMLDLICQKHKTM